MQARECTICQTMTHTTFNLCAKCQKSQAEARARAIARRKAAMLGPTEEGDAVEYAAMKKARELRARLDAR